jgi:hypothetical protein
MEWAAYAFVESYVLTKGDVTRSVMDAQKKLDEKEKEFTSKPDGDRLSDKVGVRP